MNRLVFFIGIVLLNISWGYAQNEKPTKIRYTSERTLKNEEKYPGALIMFKVNQQVIFRHEGIKVWCDQAIFYKKDNFFRALGHVKMIQGDSLTLTGDYAEYNGTTEFAFISGTVHLETKTTTLSTDSLFFDRKRQQAFYRSGGVVRDTSSTITSQIGRYYLNQKKYSFFTDVVVTNKNYVIHSDHIDFYTQSGQAFLYGPTTITGDQSKVYCERGFYDTHQDYGYFVKNSTVYYKNRKLEGDSIYFNRATHFASATNNIKITDTINKSTAWGHYAEVYQEQDSVFITKRALVARAQGKDSIYIHSDTLMVTGKPEHRVVKGFYDVRIYKSNLNGRCDSVIMREETGITKMIGNPVLFSAQKQLTGDTIELFSNTQTHKLDSLSVYYHAFLIQKDSIKGFNQVKGKMMYGLFEDNELSEAHFIKNTETIFYLRNNDGGLIGIDKEVSSSIKITFKNNEIRTIQYLNKPEGILYKPSNFPQNARKLKGFNWRGEERILSKAGLFEGEPPLDLPKIKGIPLPDIDHFFEDLNQRKDAGPLLNEESNLSPELLQNYRKDRLQPTTKKRQIKTDTRLPTKPLKKIKPKEEQH